MSLNYKRFYIFSPYRLFSYKRKYYIIICFYFNKLMQNYSWPQWPRDLRRRSATACLLRSWVRISPEAWMSACSDCCVLSGRGLCDALITRPEEFYRLWCVVVCDLKTSRLRRPWPALGRSATGNAKLYTTTLSLCMMFTSACFDISVSYLGSFKSCASLSYRT